MNLDWVDAKIKTKLLITYISFISIQIGRLVGQAAADLLLLLCDHAEAFLTHYPDIPTRIIQVSDTTLLQLPLLFQPSFLIELSCGEVSLRLYCLFEFQLSHTAGYFVFIEELIAFSDLKITFFGTSKKGKFILL